MKWRVSNTYKWQQTDSFHCSHHKHPWMLQPQNLREMIHILCRTSGDWYTQTWSRWEDSIVSCQGQVHCSLSHSLSTQFVNAKIKIITESTWVMTSIRLKPTRDLTSSDRRPENRKRWPRRFAVITCARLVVYTASWKLPVEAERPTLDVVCL